MWIRDPWLTVLKVTAIFVVMIISNGETTKVPLRLWLLVYAFLRNNKSGSKNIRLQLGRNGEPIFQSSVVERMVIESVLSGLNLIWWITGSYWMYSGGKMMANDAPKLFWLTAILMGLDLFVVGIGFVLVVCKMTMAVSLLVIASILMACLSSEEDDTIRDFLIRMLEACKLMLYCETTSRPDSRRTPHRETTSRPDSRGTPEVEPFGNEYPIYYYDDDSMLPPDAPAQDDADAVGVSSEYNLDEGEIRELPRQRHSHHAGIDTHDLHT